MLKRIPIRQGHESLLLILLLLVLPALLLLAHRLCVLQISPWPLQSYFPM